MSLDIANWFKELIKDKVRIAMQAHGGLLDNTMTTGDTNAGTVKFPVAGRIDNVYKLTGAIEMVPVGSLGLRTVPLTLEDFEAAGWWTTQDAYKAGPSEKDALAQMLTKAIRRKRDTIKLDALAAFQAANPATVKTIGTGAEVPDVLHFEQGRAEIGSYGDDEDEEVFCLIPEMYSTQLKFYTEYANAQWVGPENAPFSKTQRMRMKTIQGITYIVGPDEYFSGDGGTGLYTWMWKKGAIGAETPWSQENPSLTQHTDRQGSPWLAKVGMGGAAVGIETEGVKRFHLKKITAPVRPA